MIPRRDEKAALFEILYSTPEESAEHRTAAVLAAGQPDTVISVLVIPADAGCYGRCGLIGIPALRAECAGLRIDSDS